MKRSLAHCPTLLLVLSLSAVGCRQREEAIGEEASRLAELHVTASINRVRTEAECEQFSQELNWLDAAAASRSDESALLRQLQSVDPQLNKPLLAALRENADRHVAGLRKSLDETRHDVQALTDQWKPVHRAWIEQRICVGPEHRFGEAAELWLRLTKHRFVWLSILIPCLLLSLVCFHENRHVLRRRAAVRGPFATRSLLASWALLFGAAVVVLLFPESLLQATNRIDSDQRVALIAEIGKIEGESDGMAKRQMEAHLRHDQLVAERKQEWRGLEGADAQLVAVLFEAKSLMRQLAVEFAHKQFASESIRADLERSLDDPATSRGASLPSPPSRKERWTVGVVQAVSMLGIALASFLLFGQSKRRRRRIAETCPLCLGVGTLSQAGAPGVETLTCQNAISDSPHDECLFSFPSFYRSYDKVCFPTIGHPQSGKTHWLSMVYHELVRGNFHEQIHVQRVRSDASEQFDRIVEEVLEARISTSATQTPSLPRPLVFDFRDRDPLGASNVLLNVFDYAGEVASRMSLQDYQRRRQLDADGYLLFLDPMVSSEEQAKAVVNFHDDLRVVRRLKAGQTIDTPVAICVPKIDLLVSQHDTGATVDWFYRALEEIDARGAGADSLDAIRSRSDVMRRLRDTLWPGWRVERQVSELFGDRWMYFPMTPVGLTEIGEADLTRRTIKPYAILQPLLWLLHMNGYPVCR